MRPQQLQEVISGHSSRQHVSDCIFANQHNHNINYLENFTVQ